MNRETVVCAHCHGSGVTDRPTTELLAADRAQFDRQTTNAAWQQEEPAPLPEEPGREQFIWDADYWAAIKQYAIKLRAAAVALQVERDHRLEQAKDNWDAMIEERRRAEKAEAAIDEARAKEPK